MIKQITKNKKKADEKSAKQRRKEELRKNIEKSEKRITAKLFLQCSGFQKPSYALYNLYNTKSTEK